MADTWQAISGYASNNYSDTMVFEVDGATKKLQKISGQTLIAGEKNSQYIRFIMPRYWDGIDVSEKTISIIYDLAGQYYGETAAISAERTDDSLRFGWVVPEEACCIAGTLLFVLVIKDSSYVLKTQIAETPVQKSINLDDVIPEPTKETWYRDFQVRVEQTLSAAENAVEEAQSTLEQARSLIGSPLVANIAEEMTDTSRIYVYTGSETGYTTGNWYYYNTGTSAWTSGGVYNAVAVDTDTTLTIAGKPADSKKTGDEISQIKEDLSDMNTATASDVGKYLRATAVENGKVTGWQFSTPSGGGGGGGQDGFSPIVAVTNITGGHRVSITDADGTKAFDVMDGTNGVSPTITVTNITGGHRVSITDATGTKTFDVMDGSGSGGSSVSVDDTLTVSGAAADAKAAGDRISDLDSRVTDIEQGGTSSIGEFLGNTPLTLTEDANIKLVATQTTEYDLGSGTVADFSKRKNVTLRNVTMSVNSNNVELNIASSVTNFYDAYAQMNFDGFEVGEEYTITIEPLGNQTDLVAGGTFYFRDSGSTALANPIVCMDETMTQTFTATTTSIILQIYPANSVFWEDNYRTAKFKSMVITGRLKGSFNGTFSAGNVASGTTITSTPSCKVYAVEDTSVYKSRHAGKTCVCFGDSVTGFMSPPNDYPSVLAQLTGMTVYNVGFGGCRMSDTHPYAAYKRFGMCALVDAIVSGDWTEQDQYVDQIEAETFPQAHLTTLKRIDWNGVDFVTIFYGGNDAGNDVAIGTAGNSDKQTFVGALKYAVDKLLTAYPHLKILVLTQIFRYWLSDSKDSDEMEFTMGGQTYHYYDWGDEEIKAAQLLKVPVVDMYRTLGINSITRTLYLRTSDQTHPSAEGNRLIAGKIAGKLLSEY